MIYKDFHGLKLSALGLGCMRLPLIGESDSAIDEETAAKMVAYALAHGINYFDTAWGYHGGNSETVMGRILKRYPRESFYLASKFPGFDVGNLKKKEEIFERQLEKCQVDYFDFYLFHNVAEKNIDAFMDPQYGVFEYLVAQKQAGRIHHLGFSTHGSLATIRRFLDAYGKELEFCQIQLNYLDWDLQNAKAKVALIQEYGLPVWVMEPLRGGKLAKLEPEAEAVLKSLRPDEEIPAWGFRFLQSVEGVTMVLSGMSNDEQLRANIRTFCEEKPLTEKEKAALMSIAREMIEKNAVPCTACRYCTAKCPRGLEIPEIIAAYNTPDGRPEGTPGRDPSRCVGCRSCESVCPQGIRISEVMTKFTRR